MIANRDLVWDVTMEALMGVLLRAIGFRARSSAVPDRADSSLQISAEPAVQRGIVRHDSDGRRDPAASS